MSANSAETHVRGKTVSVPSVQIDGRVIVALGNWVRTAQVKDEELVEGKIFEDPALFIARLKASDFKADIFTFAQKPPATTPNYCYPWEWDNWAAIPISSFKQWWEERLPQESRKNVRRAAKRGVIVKAVPFSPELVTGIKGIYDETPIRQGKPFWHFGKDFETVKRENETYSERSEFVGAFYNGELIGFIKITFVDRTATIMQILSKNAHYDKRPMNAMLAHTVELCERKRVSHLIYGQYVYGKKQNSSLTEFKRRNGFEEIKFPRYFVPLSLNGRLAVAFGLHLGVSNLIPGPVNDFLLKVRARTCRSWIEQHRSLWKRISDFVIAFW